MCKTHQEKALIVATFAQFEAYTGKKSHLFQTMTLDLMEEEIKWTAPKIRCNILQHLKLRSYIKFNLKRRENCIPLADFFTYQGKVRQYTNILFGHK